MTLTTEPMTVTIGAEIGGVDRAGELSAETIAEIRAALPEWVVTVRSDGRALRFRS